MKHLTEHEILRMKVRTHRRTPRWVLITRLIAFLALIIGAWFIVPWLIEWQGEQIDIGLQTQDEIYEGLREAKENRNVIH